MSKRAFAALLSVVALYGCGGNDDDGPAAGTASVISGVAAVGSPIVGGNVKVICATGSTLVDTRTESGGTWRMSLPGQTLPCAVQVSSGTVNGAANGTAYHAIAISPGTVNVTPLSDLLVANVVGVAVPGTWFGALSASTLAALNQASVDAALARLRTALAGLPPLGSTHPITTAFTPTAGDAVDDMLSALKTAMTRTGLTYDTLLASAAQVGFTAPAGFGTALGYAYAGTSSGGSIAIPAVPAGVSATASGSGQINVNWTSVSGAVAYAVYRSASASVQIVEANKVASVTAGPFVDTGRTASTTYYYRVTASNRAGETTGSAEVSATTTTTTTTGGSTGSTPGGGGDAGTAPTPGTQLGGSIQGTALNVSGAVTTLAGGGSTFNQTTLGDGTGAAAIFLFPGGVASDGTNLYVADTSQHAIRKVAIATGVVTTLAGDQHFGLVDATGGAARFKKPAGITTDGTNVYVADTENNAIRKIVIATGVVTTLAGNPAKKDIAGKADGIGAAAEFNRPEAITTDGINLYVGDTQNYSVRKIVIATGAVTTLAASPTNNLFFSPTGLTVVDGNLYVVSDESVIKVVIATGQASLFAGGKSLGYLDGTGTAAGFSGLYGITSDGVNLYTSSAINHNIRKIVIATGVVTTIAGAPGAPFVDGFAGSGYADGTGTAARFSQPRAITTDGVSLFIADTLNNRIRKLQ